MFRFLTTCMTPPPTEKSGARLPLCGEKVNSKVRKSNRFNVLEPRVLYSATPFPMDPDIAPDSGTSDGSDADSSFSDLVATDLHTFSSLVLVDGSLDNFQSLVDELSILRDGVRIEVIPQTADLFAWMDDLFREYHDLERVELFAHGDASGLLINGNRIDFQNNAAVERFAGSLDQIMVSGGDLLLYGCDLAASEQGQLSLQRMSEFGHVDIAASSDLTGSSHFGGNWDLEFVVGDLTHPDSDYHNRDLQWEGILTTASPSASLTGKQETSARDRGSDRSVVMHTDGSFVIVWSDDNIDGQGWGVAFQRFDAAGNSLGPALPVNNLVTVDNQQWASVAMDASGNFVVTWTNEDGNDDVHARLYNSLGNPVADEFRVNAQSLGSQINASVAMASDGTFVVTWQGNGPVDANGIFARRFDASGNPLTGDILVNPASLNAQWDPSISINSTGNFLIGWDDSAGYHVQRLFADGTKDGSALTVSSNSSAGNGSVLLNNDNTFAVTWRETVFTVQTSFVRVYDVSNNSSGPPVLVGPFNTRDQVNPAIGGDGTGSFIITWEGDVTGLDDVGVFLRRFNSDGSYASGVELVNTYTTGTQEMASVDVLDANHYVVVWSGQGAADNDGVFFATFGGIEPSGTDSVVTINEDAVYALRSSDFGFSSPFSSSLNSIIIEGIGGGKLWLGAAEIGTGTVVSVADISAGKLKFLAVEDSSGIAAGSVTFRVNDGTSNSASTNTLQFNITPKADSVDIVIGTGSSDLITGSLVNDTIPGNQELQAIASLSSGGYVVVWQSTDGYLADGDYGTRVFGQLFDANGQKIGFEFPIDNVSAGNQIVPRVTGLSDGGFIVVWEGAGIGTDIFAQRFNAAGNFLTMNGNVSPGASAFVLNQYKAGMQVDVDIVATADGFVASWASIDPAITNGVDLGIVARFFDLQGNAGQEFQVNQFDTGVQRGVRLAQLDDQRVIVTWLNQNGNSYDIQGSVLYVGETTPGTEFTVNNRTPLRQSGQQVASLGENGFVVTWQSENGDGSGYGIMARRFDLNGNPIDADDMSVNLLTNSNQRMPEVVGFADGSYTVFWHTWDVDADGNGIASRKFNAMTNGFGEESSVNRPQVGHQVNAQAVLLKDSKIALTWETSDRVGSQPNFGSEVMGAIIGHSGRGFEDSSIPLNLSIGLHDNDGSETISSINLTSIPSGVTISDGTNTFTATGLSSLNISSWNLAALTLRPPQNFHGTIDMGVSVETTDGGDTHTTTAAFRLHVDSVNDPVSKGGYSISTTSSSTVNIAASQVVHENDDPDHVSSTPPAVTPRHEYVVNAGTSGTPDGFGNINWLDTLGGPSISLAAASSGLIPAPNSMIGDIRQAFDLSGAGGGLLDLSGLSSGQTAFELWVQPDSMVQQKLIFEWGSSSHGLAIYQDVKSIRVAYATGQSVLGFTLPNLELVGNGLLSSQFNQIVVVVDSVGGLAGNPLLGDFALYLNGKLVDIVKDIAGMPALTAASINTFGGPGELVAGVGTAVGSVATTSFLATTAAFDGQIGRIAIFDQGLSDAEILNRHVAIENAVRVASIESTNVNGPASVLLASGATVNFLADGSFDYDPNSSFNYLFNGQTAVDQFTYSVTDQSGVATAVTVNVTVTGTSNQLPVANGDNPGTFSNSTTTTFSIASLLGNDTDPNGDSLSMLDFVQPLNGTLVDNGNGTLTYTPDSGYTGPDSFAYTITDGGLGITHYWNLDGGARDTTGGLNGSIIGAQTVDGDKGLHFNKLNGDHVQIPDVNYGSSFTLSFDFKFDDIFGTSFRTLYSHGAQNTTNSIQVFLRESANTGSSAPGTLATIVRDGNDSASQHELNINASGIAGGWHTYTLVVEQGVGSKVYLDGLLQGSTARGADGVDPAGSVFLGARSDLAATRFLTGSIADVALTNWAMGATQVASLPGVLAATTGTVSLTVNTPPTVSDEFFSTDEDTALPGNVSTNDSDIDGGPLTYSLVSQTSGGFLVLNPNGTFSFDPLNSFDGLTNGQSAGKSFTYLVTDTSGGTSTGTASITVTGVNDAPQMSAQSFSVNENAVNGFSIGSLVVSDPDHASHTFAFVQSGHPFAIDSFGNIFVSNAGLLDFETFQNYVLTATATDGDGDSVSATITINVGDINERPTGISPTNMIVPENTNTTGGYSLGVLNATDPDTADTFVYTIQPGQDGAKFGIGGAGNNELILTDGTLDFEAKSSYLVLVRVTDGAGNFHDQVLTVNVADLNETPTISNQTFGVNENSSNGTVVGTVVSTDFDSGANGVRTYSIMGGNGASAFSINSSTGQITVADSSQLDFESNPLFTLTVQVTDGGTPGLSATATITINIGDVNEPPVFAGPESFNVNENSTAIFSLAPASDVDGNGLTYKLLNAPDSAYFLLNSTTLTLELVVPLDFELPQDANGDNVYELVIEAKDSNGAKAYKSVTVRINDVANEGNGLGGFPGTGNGKGKGGNSAGGNGNGNGSGNDPDSGDGGDAGSGDVTPPVGGPGTGNGDKNKHDSSDAQPPAATPNRGDADTLNNKSVFEFGDEFKSSIVDRTIYQSKYSARGGTHGIDQYLRNSDQRIGGGLSLLEFEDQTGWFEGFARALDDNREELQSKLQFNSPTAVSTAAGLLAIGYLTWAIKGGGTLLSAFVSSLPAWQSFDPLPVIESTTRENTDDDTSIEQLVDV